MDQPAKKGPRFDGGGFASAAALAPGMAMAICFLGVVLTGFSIRPEEIIALIGSLLLLLLLVSLWGVLPSLLFGGLVLAAIQRFGPERPHGSVFVVGGGVAAALYVLAGLAAQRVSPTAAIVFAPWASTPHFADAWWVWTSLLLSGLAAGLIYARFAKRG